MKIRNFEELVKNNKITSSFDVKALHRRFRKVKNVIHVDCYHDKDKVEMTMESTMLDIIKLCEDIVKPNSVISILDWITRVHVILNTLLDFRYVDDALCLAQCSHTIISSFHRKHGEKLAPVLAVSHHDLAMCYTRCGMHSEAVKELLAAVQIKQDLANKKPDDHTCCLAVMNHRLSACFGEMEKYEDAIASIRTTIRCRMKLAIKAPTLYLQPLAQAQLDLGGYLYSLGRYTESAEAESNALTSWIDLTEIDTEAFMPGLALAQHNYSVTLFGLQRTMRHSKGYRLQ